MEIEVGGSDRSPAALGASASDVHQPNICLQMKKKMETVMKTLMKTTMTGMMTLTAQRREKLLSATAFVLQVHLKQT